MSALPISKRLRIIRGTQFTPIENALVGEAADTIEGLYEALEWILQIAEVNFEQDDTLRSQGARTLMRIADRADAALALARGEGK